MVECHWLRSFSAAATLALATLVAAGTSAQAPPGGSRKDLPPVTIPGTRGPIAGQAVNPFELPAGGSITVELEVTVNNPVPAGTDSVCNQGTMTGGNFVGTIATDDPDLGGVSDPTCTLIDASPVLGAGKLVSDAVSGNDDGMAQPGEVLTYTITVSNSGDEGAADVVITDTAPPNTTYDDGSATIAGSAGATGAAITTNAGSLRVDVAELAGGGFVTVTFTATVAASVPAGTATIDNLARVAATGIAPLDSSPASIPVDADPSLAADKLASDAVSGNDDGLAGLGEILTYTITVSNSGDEGAANVVIIDAAPPNTTYDDGSATITGSAAATGAAITTNAGSLRVDVAELAGGGFVTVTFTVTVAASLPAGTTTIDNLAQVSATGIAQLDSSPASIPLGDNVPPVVTAVDTRPPTGGGLSDGEITTLSLAAFLVTYSEPVQDPPGDTDPFDVTNPANYLLVEGGPDGIIQTLSCAAGPAGDDVAIPIAGVVYDEPSLTASIPLGRPLPPGSYAFCACGSTSIVDLAGNRLEGGGDFVVAFQVIQMNIPVLNPIGGAVLALLLLVSGWWVVRRREAPWRGAALLMALLLLTAAGASAATVDDLADPVAPQMIQDPGSFSATTAAAAGQILGGEREAVVWRFSGAGTVSATLGGGGITLSVPAATQGQLDLVYDGVGSAGLGGVDLTSGGASTMRLRIDALDVAGAEVGVEVLDTTGNLSIAGRVLPAVAAPTDFLLSFVHDFVPGVSEANAADFSSVAKLSVWLWFDGGGAGGSLGISLIDTVGPGLIAEKVDLDTTNSPLGATPVAPGGTIRYRLTITNLGGDATAVDVADIIPGATTLAGAVTTTPVAINDAYETQLATPLQVLDPASGLLANDQDPDDAPGPSSLMVTAFDATSAKSAGSNVTVAADGTFSYAPPPGFIGVDSFGYTVTDDEGEPATAEVHLLVIGGAASIAYSGGNWTWTPPATILTGQVPNLADYRFVTTTTDGCNTNGTNTIRFYDNGSGRRYDASVTFSASDVPHLRAPLVDAAASGSNYVQNASGSNVGFAAPGTVTFTFHRKGWREKFY